METEQDYYQSYLEATGLSAEEFTFKDFMVRKEQWQGVAPLNIISSPE